MWSVQRASNRGPCGSQLDPPNGRRLTCALADGHTGMHTNHVTSWNDLAQTRNIQPARVTER